MPGKSRLSSQIPQMMSYPFRAIILLSFYYHFTIILLLMAAIIFSYR